MSSVVKTVVRPLVSADIPFAPCWPISTSAPKSRVDCDCEGVEVMGEKAAPPTMRKERPRPSCATIFMVSFGFVSYLTGTI